MKHGNLQGETEARQQLTSGCVVMAVKILRDRNGLPLSEALRIVEGWMPLCTFTHPIPYHDPSSPHANRPLPR